MPGMEAESKTPATPAAAPQPKGSDSPRTPVAPRTSPTSPAKQPDAEAATAAQEAQAAQDAAADKAFDDLATADEGETKKPKPAAPNAPAPKPAQEEKADDEGDEGDDEGDEDDLESEQDEEDDEDGEDVEADDEGDEGDDESAAREDESRVPKVYRGMTQRERIRAARVALINSDLFTQAEIDAMPKEQLLARGAKILKQEAAWKARKEPAATRRQPDQDPDPIDESDDDGSVTTDPDEDDDEDPALDGRSGEDDDDEEDSARDRQSPAVLTKLMKVAKKSLQLTNEETAALAKQARKILAVELKKPAAQLAQAQQKLAAIQQHSGQMARALCASRFRAAVHELRSSFPMLSQPAEIKAFVAFVASQDPKGEKALGDGKEYSKFVKRMAWAEYGHRMEETARRALIESGEKGRKGAPDTSGVTPTSRGELSEDQYADQVFSTLAADGVPKERRNARLESLAKRRKKPGR